MPEAKNSKAPEKSINWASLLDDEVPLSHSERARMIEHLKEELEIFKEFEKDHTVQDNERKGMQEKQNEWYKNTLALTNSLTATDEDAKLSPGELDDLTKIMLGYERYVPDYRESDPSSRSGTPTSSLAMDLSGSTGSDYVDDEASLEQIMYQIRLLDARSYTETQSHATSSRQA